MQNKSQVNDMGSIIAPGAREAAFRAFGAYRRGEARPELQYGFSGESSGMSASETALAMRILNGVMQNMAFCDYIASCFSSIELKKLHPLVLDILRISIYQIVFLTRIPHSAAVNEGVKLAKKYSNQRAAGYVNAILRKVSDCAANNRLPEAAGGNERQRLSVKYSHPEWLVGELCDILGQEDAEKLMRDNNSAHTPVTAQVNTLMADTDTVLSMLADDGVEAKKHDWLDSCVDLHSPGNITLLEAFKRGHVYIQDAAARLAVEAAAPEPGDFVIDGCAAPGGKSFASAIRMKNTGRIAACDVSAAKLSLIEGGAMRLGLSIIETMKKDATENDGGFLAMADVVIADVPCSGLGVIRKKPDIRYKAHSDISALPDIQIKILSNLSSYVKPGGTLLYSTCTILKQENEDVVEAFLRENREFSLAAFSLSGIGRFPGGMATLWPHIHGTDGFYICVMARRPTK